MNLTSGRIKVISLVTLMVAAIAVGFFLTKNRDQEDEKPCFAIVGFLDSDVVLFVEAAETRGIRIESFTRDEFFSADSPVKHYDAALVRTMGMSVEDVTPEAREKLDACDSTILYPPTREDLAPFANNPEGFDPESLSGYMLTLTPHNALGALAVITRAVTREDIDVPEPEDLPKSGYFYLDGNVSTSFDKWLKRDDLPKLPEDAPRVAIVGGFINPYKVADLRPLQTIVEGFAKRGIRAVPIYGFRTNPEALEPVKPDLVIVFPLGRILPDDAAPALFERVDVPVMAAIALSVSRKVWESEPIGMTPTYQNLAVALPELDGATAPTPVSTIDPNEDGYEFRTPIPDRIERMLDRAQRWITLRNKPNSEKRLAFFYRRGPGAAPITAQSLDAIPSLYNTLIALQKEGYDLGPDFPETEEEFAEIVNERGRLIGQWAPGAFRQFLEKGFPERVATSDYRAWAERDLPEASRKETVEVWGPAPGVCFTGQLESGDSFIAVSRVQFGNVVLMPQPTTALVEDVPDADDFSSVHGTNKAPPHFYQAAYLWAREGFKADAIVHFGTHGSLEFTRGKSLMLMETDWPDALIGELPNVYLYSVNNVGEALLAKRRIYATLISHTTPPFVQASPSDDLIALEGALDAYEGAQDETVRAELAVEVERLARENNLTLFDPESSAHVHKHARAGAEYDPDYDLNAGAARGGSAPEGTGGMSGRSRGMSEMGGMGSMGGMGRMSGSDVGMPPSMTRREHDDAQPTQPEPVEPQADAHDKHDVHADETAHEDEDEEEESIDEMRVEFYRDQLLRLVETNVTDGLHVVGRPWTEEQLATTAEAIGSEDALENLRTSTEGIELARFIAALSGRFIPPSTGGDPLVNPDSLPTGRNMSGTNVEQTPDAATFRVAQRLTDEFVDDFKAENGRYPQRIAVTLWGGEYLRTRGLTLAQALWAMGVRPVWDRRGSLRDLEIVPAEELKRPRIDILIQTSGQFRDAAPSRIALLDRAARMVAALEEEEPYPNYVREHTLATERDLMSRGYLKEEAAELATARVFGSPRALSYGTGIRSLVERSDKWQTKGEIADRYLLNMGGIYRSAKVWGVPIEGLLESNLRGTDVVLQSRSSNVWGPVKLDHLYEFGTIESVVREKTGVEPTFLLSDARRTKSVRTQKLDEAIRDEMQTTFWNRRWLEGLMREKGGTGAATLAKATQNLFGWSAVGSEGLVDDATWRRTVETLVDDKLDVGVREYFEETSPAALAEITAVALDAARKDFWNPTQEELERLAATHAEMIKKYGPPCSYNVCGNVQLREYIAANLPETAAQDYRAEIDSAARDSSTDAQVSGVELVEKKREEDSSHDVGRASNVDPVASRVSSTQFAALVLAALVIFFLGFFTGGGGSGRRA